MTNDERQAQYQQLYMDGLDGCSQCSHVPDADLEIAKMGVAIWAKRHGGWEHDIWGDSQVSSATRTMVGLAMLPMGGFIVVHEGEDSSGHGCQCNGEIGFYETLDLALRLGLTQDERASYLEAQDA